MTLETWIFLIEFKVLAILLALVREPIDEQTVEQQQDNKTEEDQPDTGYNNG